MPAANWLPPADFIDLRSDTVTRPTPEMREAMKQADVGNAAFGEDPTVNRLEELSARVLGKEAALFVPSGTMGNQVAVRVHTARVMNPEVFMEAKAHLYVAEAAGVATVSHAQVRPVQGVRGVIPPDVLDATIGTRRVIHPTPALVCLENTHNYSGGAAVTPAEQKAVREVADKHGIPVHLDGARIFNAAVALDVDPAKLAEDAHSVQFCFSKGLGAPVGSIVVGDADFIAEADHVRQYLGGSMRQAGVIAAAALVGMEKERFKLADDHARAKRLAKGVADAPGIRLVEEPDTNIAIFDVADLGVTSGTFAEALKKHDVGFIPVAATEIRAVTHRDVDDDGIEKAIEAAHAVAREFSGKSA